MADTSSRYCHNTAVETFCVVVTPYNDKPQSDTDIDSYAQARITFDLRSAEYKISARPALVRNRMRLDMLNILILF